MQELVTQRAPPVELPTAEDGGRFLPAQRCRVGSYEILLFTSAEPLRDLIPQWQELAGSTDDPNPFYESFLLLPAMELLPNARWQIVTVWGRPSKNSDQRLLGFVPLIWEPGTAFFPCRRLSLANHVYNFLTTPLLARGMEADVIAALIEFVHRYYPKSVIEFPLLNADGAAYRGLQEVIRERQLSRFRLDEYHRAQLTRSAANPEDYFQTTIGGHSLRELRRQRRRLSESGNLELRRMTPASSGMWIDWFLNLEASGWKGETGTAFQTHSHDARFFRQIVQDGANSGQVEMLGLFLKGEPIALKCNLLSGPGVFTFKIAFQEALSKYSPGVQLELDMVQQFYGCAEYRWMDSCASPRHFMINRLWKERRPIQHLLVSTGGACSDLFVASLPLLQGIRRTAARWKRNLLAACSAGGRHSATRTTPDLSEQN